MFRFYTTTSTSRMRRIFGVLGFCFFVSYYDVSGVAEAVNELDLMIFNLYLTFAGVISSHGLRFRDVCPTGRASSTRLLTFFACRRICLLVDKCHPQSENLRVST